MPMWWYKSLQWIVTDYNMLLQLNAPKNTRPNVWIVNFQSYIHEQDLHASKMRVTYLIGFVLKSCRVYVVC